MNGFIMVVLEFLNHLTLGALGRCGEPDPNKSGRNCSKNARSNGSRSPG